MRTNGPTTAYLLRGVVAVAGLTFVLTGCGSGTKSGSTTSQPATTLSVANTTTPATTTTESTTTTTTTLPASTTTVAETTTTAVATIEGVDWADVEIPGSLCGVAGTIQLHGGTATLTGSKLARPPQFPTVDVAAEGSPDSAPITYGNLLGGGTDAAGDQVFCNNGGGTADGELAQGWVIFTESGSLLQTVGVVTPQKASAPGANIPYVSSIAIAPGQVTASEVFYNSSDPTCCPSGQATTVWSYAHGSLTPGPTEVEAP